MKSTKRIVSLQYNYYKELEQKLENYAKKGLILQKIGGLFYTFAKSEPQNLKYTVTYFKEGSIFNPDHTENQSTYIDYAAASGWDFVCDHGQMQIFVSSAENPVPFETDEEEMLDNIHTCMKKQFLPSQIVMFFLWIMNLCIRIPSILKRPTNYLADGSTLASLLLFTMVAVFTSYTILKYFRWYVKSKKSLALGGEILNPCTKFNKFCETCYLIALFALLFYMFAQLFSNVHLGIILICVAQVPLFGGVFYGVMKLLKRHKVSAIMNKIITFAVYGLVIVLYLTLVFVAVASFDFAEPTEKPYRTVEWRFVSGEPQEYRIYSDDIPLTCQDLYGEIDFPDYSYEEKNESTFLLHKDSYKQVAPPTKDSPPEIRYAIYQSPYRWVNELVLDELLAEDEIFDLYADPLDNALFGTENAYNFYYLRNGVKFQRGDYVLVYADKIIHLDVMEPLSDAQIAIVNEKFSVN